jgi:choline-sulfatase
MDLVKKPRHPLSYSHYTNKEIRVERDHYDEYIADVDAEFGRLIDTLEENGVLDNSYIVIASDHGEVFERGEIGHGSALLYEGVVRTPLIISAPGQTDRLDIHAPTSNIDLLPTVLHLTGNEIPPGLDGQILPGLGGSEDIERPILLLEAKENSSFAPITKATVALRKGSHKLIYYTGYPRYKQKFELFNLQEDPAELTNIYTLDPIVANDMQEELLSALEDANKPFIS